MWNSNKVIRIEVGRWIVKESNSPDTRNIISKWWNGPKEDDGQFLLTGTTNVRKSLANNHIHLPNIQFVDNSNIGSKEFICYWGIETGQYSLESLTDLFEFIYAKAVEYHNYNIDDDQKLLSLIKKDKYQEAYNFYTKTYYKARINLDFHTCSRCLTEVAVIVAQNNQMEPAFQFAFSAINYAEGLNIVDAYLKCQCYFNAANLIKYSDSNNALQLLNKCRGIAYKSGNSLFFFLANMTMAEICGYYKNFNLALDYYKTALNMVTDNSKATLSIQSAMLHTYECLLNQTCQSINSVRPNWRNTVLNLTLSIVKQVFSSTVSGLIMKAFNIQGVFSLFTYGQSIELNDNIFNAPTCIGDNNKIINY